MGKGIAVITDSGTDVPADYAAEHGVRVIPLMINYADGSYRSGIDISAEEVVARFAAEIPQTSTPSPQDFLEAYEQAKSEGFDQALVITISTGLSSTNQAARIAADMIEDFPVATVDTKSIGIGCALQVFEGVRLVESGMAVDEICQRLEALAQVSRVYFSVRSLEYLLKGGRISHKMFVLGSALNIKPVLFCDAAGKYAIVKLPRGWKKALSTQIDIVAEQANKFEHVNVGICCTAAEQETFDEVEARLRAAIPGIQHVTRANLSASLVVHTGPGLVGITFAPTVDR